MRPQEEEEDEQEEVMSEADFRSSLSEKSRKELQALAKIAGVKANLSSSKIIDYLVALQQA